MVEYIQEIYKKDDYGQIVILGDFAIDLYYEIDEEDTKKVLSVETGDPVEVIRNCRFSPGGAANVAANLLSLKDVPVFALGVVGTDPFGDILLDMLNRLGVETRRCLRDSQISTAVYSKMLRNGKEILRFDLGFRQMIGEDTATLLLKQLEEALPQTRVLVINQQILHGFWSSAMFRDAVKQLLKTSGFSGKVIVDSRDYADSIPGSLIKLNQKEAASYIDSDQNPDYEETWSWDPVSTAKLAERLSRQWEREIVITRGSYGAVCTRRERNGNYCVVSLPGVRVEGEIDPVGAGDSFLAGLVLAIASDLSIESAVGVGNLVSAVTVKKVGQTGSATIQELSHLAKTASYYHAPEKILPVPSLSAMSANDLQSIEVINRKKSVPPSYAIFDHDGTISTLREGWEEVMKRHMLKAIIGDASCPQDKEESILRDIETFIEETTGVQTIIQMQGLVDMIRRYGFVPAEKIHSAVEYKGMYVQELRQNADLRLERLNRSGFGAEMFTLAGVVPFLHALKKRDVKLYLASGTDQEDARKEAYALGYGPLFEEIYGSVDDPDNDPKAVVLRKILHLIPESKSREVIVFGDGPVEIREGVRQGVQTIGVLSDETRRYGWNLKKRARLVSAGADALIGDFSDYPSLISFLWGE